MARAPRDNILETRNKRLDARVKPRKEPYWRKIHQGTFLGYAKGSTGSSWVVRQRHGDGYVSQRIGTPDDHAAADGQVVLTYSQAVKKAAEVQVQERVPQPKHYGDGATLNRVVETYITSRTTTPGGRTNRVMSADSAKITRQLWARHAGRLGESLVTALDAQAIRAWHVSVSTTPPAVRGKVQPFDVSDPDQVRARRESANRILTIVKAALSHARATDSLPVSLPDYWRNVKPFSIEEGATPRMLERDEITRLLNAAAPDLRELLTAALMTGARYGEASGLKVSDYSAETNTVRIAQGKTGKVLWQPLTAEGARFFDAITAGRDPSEVMLRRADGGRWEKSAVARPMRAAVKAAGLGEVSFKTTRASYGKLLLLATKDIELVARALGHSDSRITRKHYAAYLPSEVSRGISRMPSLGIDAGSKVRKIRKTAA